MNPPDYKSSKKRPFDPEGCDEIRSDIFNDTVGSLT